MEHCFVLYDIMSYIRLLSINAWLAIILTFTHTMNIILTAGSHLGPAYSLLWIQYALLEATLHILVACVRCAWLCKTIYIGCRVLYARYSTSEVKRV